MSDEPFSALLVALESRSLPRVRQALSEGALRPLADAQGKHARVLLDRLLDTDDPALAQALISAGALPSERVRQAALERGARRLADALAPREPLLSRVVGALPTEGLAVLFALVTSGFLLAQVTLAGWIAPGWLDWAFQLSETGTALLCLLLSLVEAGALCLWLLVGAEHRPG